MNATKFLKPNIFKILVFLFIGVTYLYFSKENVSAIGFNFAFFYDSYGYPFPYLITGEINSALGHIKTLFLGGYFQKGGNFLFNPLTLMIDVVLIYLLACTIALLFKPQKKL